MCHPVAWALVLLLACCAAARAENLGAIGPVYPIAERNLLGLHGAVPGPKGGMVMIKEARKQ